MAPAIRYARDLVSQGYVGKVLATVFVGSGIAWGPFTDKAHAYFYNATCGATTLTVPTMHALDAMTFVLGDLAEVRAISAIRRETVRLSDTGQDIPVTAPDHVAISGRFTNGAIASVFNRGGVSRGNNLRWEINGREGDLVLTSPIGNLQVVNPTLEGARDGNTEVKPLTVPPEYDLTRVALPGPAANVARLYAAFSRGLSEAGSAKLAPDFTHANYLHGWLRAIEVAAETGYSQTRA
jgi:predicted dehydrogenase